MSMNSEALFDAALALPRDSRAELAERLLISLHDELPLEDPAEVEAAWTAEAERRLAEFEAGTAVLVPGEEVLKMLRERARRMT